MTKIRTTISPMLSVREAAKAVEFYKKAFGAVKLHRVSSPNGDIVAELAVDAQGWPRRRARGDQVQLSRQPRGERNAPLPNTIFLP